MNELSDFWWLVWKGKLTQNELRRLIGINECNLQNVNVFSYFYWKVNVKINSDARKQNERLQMNWIGNSRFLHFHALKGNNSNKQKNKNNEKKVKKIEYLRVRIVTLI